MRGSERDRYEEFGDKVSESSDSVDETCELTGDDVLRILDENNGKDSIAKAKDLETLAEHISGTYTRFIMHMEEHGYTCITREFHIHMRYCIVRGIVAGIIDSEEDLASFQTVLGDINMIVHGIGNNNDSAFDIFAYRYFESKRQAEPSDMFPYARARRRGLEYIEELIKNGEKPVTVCEALDNYFS